MTTTNQSAADISAETLDMLKKLYDRSKRSDSHLDTQAARESAEQEAAQAAEMLSRLLDKYGLALADVDSKGNSHQISAGHVQERTIDFGKSNFAWKIDLAKAVIKHNNCQILKEIYSRNKISGFVLVGLTLHVDATMMMLEWLFAQIKAIASADYKSYKAEHPSKYDHIDPLRWHTSFGKGAGQRLAYRLQEMRDQQAAAAAAAAREANGEGPVVTLAVNIGTAIRDYLETKEPWRKERREADEAWTRRRDMAAKLNRIQPRAWSVWLAWQQPMVQLAILAAMGRQMDTDAKARAEQEKEWAKEDAKRAAYQERYYRTHGHYPGEGRRRGRTVVDNTDYTAFDAGYDRASGINMTPYLNEGSKGTAPGALGE
jgi:hypothetical protein